MEIDIGTLCTHCGRDTAFGSVDEKGNKVYLFVNRVPGDGDAELVLQGGNPPNENPKPIKVTVTGYICPECLAFECDSCDGMIGIDEDIALEREKPYDYVRVCEPCSEKPIYKNYKDLAR